MKKTFLTLSLLGAAVWAMAQATVTASVDKNALTLDDELTLTVRVSGVSGNMVMPQLPSLPAFNVYSREVEQNTVNDNTTLEFRYVMLPRFAGPATIGPITFTHGGKTYKTAPISVRIYRTAQSLPAAQKANRARTAERADPSLPPLESSLANQAYARGNENYFLVAAVSNKTPYVNEPFTLAVRFYYSQPFYEAPYQKPSVTNLFMHSASTAQGTQSIGGTLYRYEEQRYQLAAAAPGAGLIGPASVRYQTGASPMTAFDRLFGGAAVSEEQTAESSPITIHAQAVPASGKPASFYGAVGQGYTITAAADPTQVEAGEAVNVTVTVKGPDNLKSTGDLTFPSLAGFKIYPAAPESGSLPAANGQPRGYKTFKTVLVPAASGVYVVPAVKWSYFDPKTKQYVTLNTSPLQLTVTPSTKTESGFNFAKASGASGLQTLGSDVRYLKTTYAPEPGALAKLAAWKNLNALFLGLLAAGALFASVGRKSLAQKRAYAAAKNALKKAPSEEAVADAVSGYLQEKLKISTGSLPLKSILAALKERGVKPSTAEAFSLLWQRLDAARFAPSGHGAHSATNLSTQAQDVLKLLEEECK